MAERKASRISFESSCKPEATMPIHMLNPRLEESSLIVTPLLDKSSIELFPMLKEDSIETIISSGKKSEQRVEKDSTSDKNSGQKVRRNVMDK